MTDKIIHIEKYDVAAFRKEQKPYAQILNEVIQRFPMSHSDEFLLWCFLESLPETWKPNKNHIMEYFSISARKYERLMAWLSAVGLIEYRRIRNKNGSFHKWELIVLNGTKFNPNIVNHHSANIDGMGKKSPKVIHILDDHHSAKNGEMDKPPKTEETQAQQGLSPLRQKSTKWVSDAHINTTKTNRKERKKTNKENPVSVSVFSCKENVKTHINMVIANRDDYVEEDIVDQGVYYAYETNQDKSFDAVNKRINIFLKKVREGKWLIPQGFQGITSQSIREREETLEKEKQEQYKQEGKAFRAIASTVLSPTGSKSLSELLNKLKSG
jgi:hypothetical protein